MIKPAVMDPHTKSTVGLGLVVWVDDVDCQEYLFELAELENDALRLVRKLLLLGAVAMGEEGIWSRGRARGSRRLSLEGLAGEASPLASAPSPLYRKILVLTRSHVWAILLRFPRSSLPEKGCQVPFQGSDQSPAMSGRPPPSLGTKGADGSCPC